MSKPYTLYWSSLSLYEECPQSFLWQKGWSTIDLGRGYGRGIKPPIRKSEHSSILGICIQKAVEHLYNDEYWRDPGSVIPKMIEKAEKEFQYELSKKYIDWRESPSREELWANISEGVHNYLLTFKQHKLIGSYAKAELEYLTYLDAKTPVGGRADVVFRRPDSGLTIIDGKNSREYWEGSAKSPSLGVDPDQLRWYALLALKATGERPSRLGFVYYRYPYGYRWEREILGADSEAALASNDNLRAKKLYRGEFYRNRDPSIGVDWVSYSDDDLNRLAERAIQARSAMESEKFDATPSASACKWCPFESICEARKNQKKSRSTRSKTTISTDSIPLEDI